MTEVKYQIDVIEEIESVSEFMKTKYADLNMITTFSKFVNQYGESILPSEISLAGRRPVIMYKDMLTNVEVTLITPSKKKHVEFIDFTTLPMLAKFFDWSRVDDSPLKQPDR